MVQYVMYNMFVCNANHTQSRGRYLRATLKRGVPAGDSGGATCQLFQYVCVASPQQICATMSLETLYLRSQDWQLANIYTFNPAYI